MGIFKDLFRDISEANLTQEQVYARRAQEAAANGEFGEAASYYRDAKEWEKAGDMYLLALRRRQFGVYGQEQDLPSKAAECFSKGKHFTKMREAYKEVLWTYYGLRKEDVENLKNGGQLEPFVKNILSSYSGPDVETEEKRRCLGRLFEKLLEADAFTQAAELFFHFWKALAHNQYTVIRGLLRKGNAEKALELCRFLEKEGLINEYDYVNILKDFPDAKNKGNAAALRALCRRYFILHPINLHLRFVEPILRQAGEWETCLEELLDKNPFALATALASYKKEELGEAEADVLFRCYEAVGRQHIKHQGGWTETTTKWLLYLADFWKGNGNADKESQIRSRYLNDTKETREKLSLTEIESTADMHVRNIDLAKAAALYEEAAESNKKGGYERIFKKYYLRAASLFQKAGNTGKAADLLIHAGRISKADRIMGKVRYDTSEGESMWSLFEIDDIMRSAKTKEEPGGWFQRDQSLEQLLASSVERLADPGVSLLSLFRKLHWLSDNSSTATKVRQIETFFRDHGLALNGAALWLMEGNTDEFERVCIEEDELEVAALWYEQANMPERAAKMYDLMGQSQMASGARSAGAKQKPLDTAEPKSDSTEELKGEDSGQPVCAQCGAEVKLHWTVCPKCDADLQQRKCRNCGEPLEPDWKRCPVCRTPI